MDTQNQVVNKSILNINFGQGVNSIKRDQNNFGITFCCSFEHGFFHVWVDAYKTP